jgi:hypothetical protein
MFPQKTFTTAMWQIAMALCLRSDAVQQNCGKRNAFWQMANTRANLLPRRWNSYSEPRYRLPGEANFIPSLLSRNAGLSNALLPG